MNKALDTQTDLNKLLHEQGDEINRILQTNEEVFKTVEKAELLVNKMRMQAYFEKCCLRMIAVLLTAVNLLLVFKKLHDMFVIKD